MGAFKKKSAYIVGTEDTPVTLTGSYQAGNAYFVGEAEQLALDVAYTMGTAESGNSLEVKIEFSPNKGGDTPGSDDWYREVTESVSSGTITESLAERTFSAVSAAGTYDRFHLSIPLDAMWVRVSVKETGIAANGGSVTVKAVTTIT